MKRPLFCAALQCFTRATAKQLLMPPKLSQEGRTASGHHQQPMKCIGGKMCPMFPKKHWHQPKPWSGIRSNTDVTHYPEPWESSPKFIT